jgi:hypothetical protein
MRNKTWFMWLCAAGLALLVQPAFGQPRGRGGPEERDKAVQEQPAAREQALEQEVRELQMQLKRLQETLGSAQAKPEARPSLGEPAQRGPGQAPARAQSLAGASESGFMGGRGGRGGMGRGMPGGPGWQGPGDLRGEAAPLIRRGEPGMQAPQEERNLPPGGTRFGGPRGGGIGPGGPWAGGPWGRGREEWNQPSTPWEGRGAFAGRPQGPFASQRPQGPPMAQRPVMGPGAQAGRIAPRNVAAQVRQILEQARTLIARAEQLLARQGPPTEGYAAFPQRGGGRGEGLREGRGGPGGRGRGGAFGPPAGPRGGGRFGPPPPQGY